MILRQKLIHAFLIVFVIFFVFSCQESAVEEEQTLDLDMESATELANEYMGSSNGRQGAKISVTVFKYKKDKMLYATNTDNITGYRELNEETITANTESGQWVFWFAGSGISELNGIEFDETAVEAYGTNAFQIGRKGKLWALYVSSNVEYNDDTELKYDIVYTPRGYDGDPIRLDPKLKVIGTPNRD
jgi:hypothetical protein